MSMIPMFLKELEPEAKTTRKMLALVPDDKFDWKPHEKSMTMRQLATHIAELPSWAAMALTTDELDFGAMPYTPTTIERNADILELFDNNLAKGKAALEAAKEETLDETWTLRTGDHIHSATTKAEVIRMSYNQTTHHRAQLGVYLRLLNIPIPGSYGPSADDTNF